LLEYLEEWSGKDSDIYQTVEKAFFLCDLCKYGIVDFDADGLGAGVKGDARVINARRKVDNLRAITFKAFRGSGKVIEPDGDPFRGTREMVSGIENGRTNEDYFANAKAQAWWALRRRFQLTHRAVVEGLSYNKDDIISISSSLPNCSKLLIELSQATYKPNDLGKIVINKTPNGSRSPNLADTVMMVFAPVELPIRGFFSG